MPNSSTFARLAGGLFTAGLVVLSSFAFVDDADAARRGRRGKNLAVQRINVDTGSGLTGASGIPSNFIIEVAFTTRLDPSTVNPATFQIREQNATQTGFTKQVFGDYQIAGRVVRWFPRLPGHLRDPADPAGGFYRQGHPRDNAAENAGLKAARNYQVRLLGRETFSPIRARNGRPLRRSRTANFTTVDATVVKDLFTTTTYVDAPPPQFSFSNPIDRIPSAGDQYAVRGGAKDVPNDLSISLFCTRVPLSPGTARVLGNVTLTILSRKGDKSVRRPIVGSIFVEQNFTTTLLAFEPRFALSDLGVYALRVNKNVKDLTEEFDFAPNRDRERLRAIYDWLAAARAAEILAGIPNPDPATLENPPAQLISDWPTDEAARGVLKANMLDLGDIDPDEIDPRVMVLFSTRDEPVSEDQAVLDFDRSDNLFDGGLSTAQWDQDVFSAASAIRTISGGSGVDGDFLPAGSTTLNMDSFPGGEANFRDVNIAQGVTVTLTGSLPAKLNALSFTLDGTIDARGKIGQAGIRHDTRPNRKGGAAGPGGGKGGDTATDFHNPRTGGNKDPTKGVGDDGRPGLTSDGIEAGPDEGGQGGGGGATGGSGTAYSFASGGGGGGGKEDGQTGQSGNWPGSTSWTAGPPGQGGLGVADKNDEMDPLVGGAGGGAGANQAWGTRGSHEFYGGAGGGGGGAVRVQVARTLNIGTTGVIDVRGGDGVRGNTSQTSSSSAGGGAGAGGSILLRAGQGFNVADPGNAFNVAGGIRSNQTGSAVANGGSGGAGHVRAEDANGGVVFPNGTAGVFDPVGGGVPSYVYSRFQDLGVQGRVLEFENDDINTVTSNDAIYVEIQMTREDPSVFGQPDLSAIDESATPDIFSAQGTTDTSITSPWLPLKIHDRTGTRAFPTIAYDPTLPGNPDETVFPVAEALNGNNYRFVRYRVFFQLDDAHAGPDPVPFIGFIILHFQFNF